MVRLHIQGGAYLVAIARPPLEAVPATLLAGRPSLHAWLTHHRGQAWPDRSGALLVEEVLRLGKGGALLEFACLTDALACKARLEGHRA